MKRPAHRTTALAVSFLAFAAVGLVTGARQRVDAALERGDLAGARVIQDRLAVVRLDDARQRLTLAGALTADGRFDAAVPQYERALALAPDGEQWAALAALHVRREDPEAAIVAWERGFETNRDPRYLHRASKLLLARGEPERAFAQFERALSIDPPSAMIHARLANMARQMGQAEAEVRHLRAAIGFEPAHRGFRTQLAWLLATCEAEELRNADEAIRLAEQLADETLRRDANVLDTLAAALAAGGRYNDAVIVAAEADDLATRREQEDLAASIRERLALYRSGRAYVAIRSQASG